jgi:hypothetical protein
MCTGWWIWYSSCSYSHFSSPSWLVNWFEGIYRLSISMEISMRCRFVLCGMLFWGCIRFWAQRIGLKYCMLRRVSRTSITLHGSRLRSLFYGSLLATVRLVVAQSLIKDVVLSMFIAVIVLTLWSKLICPAREHRCHRGGKTEAAGPSIYWEGSTHASKDSDSRV